MKIHFRFFLSHVHFAKNIKKYNFVDFYYGNRFYSENAPLSERFV